MTTMVCVKDYEEYAEKNMEHSTWMYYSQGAERELTLRENLRSYTRYVVIPRMLRNVAMRDLSVTVLGDRLSMPIGIAPTGLPASLNHSPGEIAASRAASEAGTVYTLGTISSTSLEDVAKSRTTNSLLWMQLYQFKSKEITEEIVKGAEANGYKALVLTVDMPAMGLRWRVLKSGLKILKQKSSPTIKNAIEKLKTTENGEDCVPPSAAIEDTLSWDHVTWLKNITQLPIVLKGILSVDDALEAVKHGASAVWVSNHGGRQLDGVPTALDVLPQISSALKGSGCEVYADGGVRWGSDVLKLLALGARAVFVGRPALWGLAHSGQDGVRSVLEILKTELDLAMHLAGCRSISDIGPHLVEKRPFAKI